MFREPKGFGSPKSLDFLVGDVKEQ